MAVVLIVVALVWLIAMPLVIFIGDDGDVDVFFANSLVGVLILIWAFCVYGLLSVLIDIGG